MDNHPIPQDVTGFQFRLIGDMTIKQFGYLAIPAVIAVIIWYLPIFALFKIVTIPLLGLIGLAFAFLPIEGRPLDLMASNFLKALFTPNQYIYQKTGGTLSFLTLPQAAILQSRTVNSVHPDPEGEQRKKVQLQAFLAQNAHTSKNPLDSKEDQFLTSLFANTQVITTPQPVLQQIVTETPTPEPISVITPTITTPLPITEPAPPILPATPPIAIAQAPQAPATQPAPVLPHLTPQIMTQVAEHENIESEDEKSKEKEALETDSALQKQAEKVQQELMEAKIKEATKKSTEEGKEAHDRALDLDKKLQDILSEKQKLEEELIALKKQLGKDNTNAKKPTLAVDKPATSNVRKIPQAMSKKIGLPTPPDVPNLLMGIIKDPRGNVLPNILVEVRDQQGNPVRAFKTNPLGQFASATALQKGIYTLAFEDLQQQHKFDLIELTVNDQIIQPLEIISVDAREELRQQLFS